jgi:hypothetical protein
MGYMGNADSDDVTAKVLECKLKGLSEFHVEGQARVVRTRAQDPLSDRDFFLLLNGTSGPDDFTFLEVVDGYARDLEGNAVDVEQWYGTAHGPDLSDFMEIVGASMDDEFWDAALVAFLDLYSTIDSAITTELYYAEYEIGGRMTSLCEGVQVEEQTVDDTEAKFEAFKEACDKRGPFAETIAVSFPDPVVMFPDEGMDFGLAPLPRVSFGYRFGQENQVAYVADGAPMANGLFLNGFWTSEGSLELDLAENLKDPWDRYGARNAARDLLAIQSAALEYLKAEHTQATKSFDAQRSLLSFEVFGGYESKEDLAAFDSTLEDKLREALDAPIQQMWNFLATCPRLSRSANNA